ncbi:MAG: hypothetical protein ACI8SE_000599 [Bacteroidia bacterium]|jgi:hypothetical protein
MKRVYLLGLITVSALTNVFAQEYMDTTNTNGNTEDVFLQLNTGNKVYVDRENWDLAFENLGTTASVLINGQKGMKLFTTPFTTADWAEFDTAGMGSWMEYLNSSSSWSSGAFNQQLDAGNPFDLGWGKYNVQNHVITGDSIFLLQLADGSFKKMFVNDLTAGTYTFTYANVDGTSELKKEVTKNDMMGQNFGYYSIVDEKVVTREPATENWDLLFTEYIIPIPTGPGQFQNYPVTGVKINIGVEVAQRDGITVTSDDTTGLNWNTNITEIGSDWKMFNRTSMQYEYAKDRTYFVRLSGGSVWKIYFTQYAGGPVGAFYYTLEKIETGASVQELLPTAVSIYPNPSANQNVLVTIDNAVQFKAVTVFNSSMQTISTQVSNEINTTSMSSGLYFLLIETTGGNAVKKLIIR